MTYTHHIRVRYGEVDMQRVVFNAHYLAYCDDALDSWLRTLDVHFERFGWDIMLKRADITWESGAGLGDTLVLSLRVTRWGNTSFDIGFHGAVGERPIFSATVTYVGVRAGSSEPMAPPPEIRQLLGEPDG